MKSDFFKYITKKNIERIVVFIVLVFFAIIYILTEDLEILLLWCVLAIPVLIHKAYGSLRRREVQTQINKLNEVDKTWNEKEIITNAKDTFTKVKEAICKGERYFAEDYLTENMKNEWFPDKKDWTLWERNSWKLTAANIAALNDYDDNDQDCVWVDITSHIENIAEEIHPVMELWKFKRGQQRWLLDSVVAHGDIKVIIEMKKIKNFSERKLD